MKKPFQSSFELTGYITLKKKRKKKNRWLQFQSSFELTGYITLILITIGSAAYEVSKLFRAYRLYNDIAILRYVLSKFVSKLFRAYRLYNASFIISMICLNQFQSSFELTGYITSC